MIWSADFRSQQGGEKSGRETGCGQKTAGISEKKKPYHSQKPAPGFCEKSAGGEAAGNSTQGWPQQQRVPTPPVPLLPRLQKTLERRGHGRGTGRGQCNRKEQHWPGVHNAPIPCSSPAAHCPLLPLELSTGPAVTNTWVPVPFRASVPTSVNKEGLSSCVKLGPSPPCEI